MDTSTTEPTTVGEREKQLKTSTDIREVLIGRIGVDSGQIMVCDPCYIDSHWKFEAFEANSPRQKDNFTFTYNGACNATLQQGVARSGGELGNGLGVASSTAFGDGVYEVYQIWAGDNLLRVEIRFSNDEELSDDDSDESAW